MIYLRDKWYWQIARRPMDAGEEDR